jgi:predicted nucleotidyltransferase
MSRHREAFEDFAERAQEELGGSLEKLVLYGSVARGEEREYSDVDVFAVVESEEDLEMLRYLAFDIGVMDYSVSISVQGTVSDKFDGFSETSFLRNVDRNGVEYA